MGETSLAVKIKECWRALRRFVKIRPKARAARIFNELRASGLAEVGRSPRLIVSLTSFPERVNDPLMLPVALYSLFRQTLKPDKIILWLKEEEFPRRETDVSPHVLAFKNNGLEIRWIHRNIRAYAKLVPSLKEFPDDIIVTVDDDRFYSRDMLRCLWDAHWRNPHEIVAIRCHWLTFETNGRLRDYAHIMEHEGISGVSSYRNFMTGFGGILYPPKALFADVLNEKLFMELSPMNDDIWFWAMAVMNRTKIAVPEIAYKRTSKSLIFAKLTNFRLISDNKRGGNDRQIRAVLRHYPEIMSVLHNEHIILDNTFY